MTRGAEREKAETRSPALGLIICLLRLVSIRGSAWRSLHSMTWKA